MNEDKEGNSFAEITPRKIRPVPPVFNRPVDLTDFQFLRTAQGCCNNCEYNRRGYVAEFERNGWVITVCHKHLMAYPPTRSRDKALLSLARDLYRAGFEFPYIEGDSLILFYKIYHSCFAHIPYSIWFESVKKE